MDRSDMLSGIQSAELEKQYFDRAAYEAERRRLRYERNTIVFSSSLEGSIQGFENWTSSGGGENNFTAVARVDFSHTYKKDKYNFFYKFKANYGMNYIEKIFFKNTDDFELGGNMGWAINEKWSYSANVGLKSQFGPKHKSRTDETLVSAFMAPGEFNVGVGFSYAKPGGPLRINISPVNGKMVTILNAELRDKGSFGETGKRTNNSIGIRVEAFFNKPFGKKKQYLYDTKFNYTSAYNDMGNPTVNWENTFKCQFTRHFAVSLHGKLLYDWNKLAAIEKQNQEVQYQYLLTLGFTMNYKNKK